MNYYAGIRPDTLDGLKNYRDHGILTGDFLRAVLSNDLMGAMGRADEDNRLTLFEICGYVYYEMPCDCHGSEKIVDAWIENKKRLSAITLTSGGAPT